MSFRHWPNLLTLALALIIPWVAVLTREAQSVAILAPTQEILDRAIQIVAQADGEIIGIAVGHVLFARSDRNGFASRLRAAGAWLVLPSLNVGCGGISLPRKSQPALDRASP